MKQGIIGEVTLGLGSAYVPVRKEFIATALSVVGSLAGSLIGGAASAAAERRAEARQRAEEAKEQAYYNRRYNESYVDTAAGQRLITRAKGIYDSQIKKAQGAAAVGGGTDASVQMAKDSANKAVGDTIADMAAQDTARQERADEHHRAAESRFAAMDMQREMQRGQNIANVASAASNAMLQAGSALAGSTSLKGSSNQSTSVAKSAANTSDIVKSSGGNGPAVQMNNMNSTADQIKIGDTNFVGTYDYKPKRYDR